MSEDFRPSTHRTFSDPDPLRLDHESTRSTTQTQYSEAENIRFPDPAVSVVTSVARHAKQVCRQLAHSPVQATTRMASPLHGHRKAPNMAKMKVVTPVFDHDLQKWVWPDTVIVDDNDEISGGNMSDGGLSLRRKGSLRSKLRNNSSQSTLDSFSSGNTSRSGRTSISSRGTRWGST